MDSRLVQRVLEEMYPLRSELVPCFIGRPGIGKTQGVQQFAAEKGVKVVTFILSNTVPSEVSGIRMPDRDTKKLEVFDDSRMSSLEDGDILFFDELLEAQPQLWSACLTLIQDRVMASGRSLPDVMIVAASNPVSSPKLIQPSVRDRFMFFNVDFNARAWAEWLHDRYKVTAAPSLLNALSYSEGIERNWNVVSPRKATKIIEWLLQGGDRAFKVTVLNDMLEDTKLVEALVATADSVDKPSAKDQIVSVLRAVGIEDAELEELSIREMLAKLRAMPEWEQVAEALASVEVE